MKIRQVRLRRFKRFTELTIRDIPESAKLIILAGPNGCGKSSLFDGLNAWHRLAWSGRGGNWDAAYYVKETGEARLQWNESVTVEFHGPQLADPIARKKAIYARSAYRNDPQFQVRQLNRQGSALDEDRFQRLIDNDASVSRNYERLASQGLEDLYEARPGATTFQQYREESIGLIREAMLRLFPGLALKGVGNPLREEPSDSIRGRHPDSPI
jgi:chromosome segregation ATPase